MDTLKHQIKQHEGFGARPYHCTSGKLTIGYGRNLDDVGITRDEADVLLEHDLTRALNTALMIFCELLDFSEARQHAIVDMIFNLGPKGFRGFRKMIAAIYEGDWATAAYEAESSMWYRQVGKRGERIVLMLRTGEDQS